MAGTYACACPAGFTAPATGGTCTDDDECAGSPCGAGSCTNTPGSYACTCDAGYAAPASGGTCTDIDECALATTCAGAISCTNTEGGFTCACQPGYYDVGGTCQPGACLAATDDCSIGATCADTSTSAFTCSCDAPWFTGTATGGTCTRRPILVFSDRASHRALFEAAITAIGWTAEVATSGLEFNAKYDTLQPAAIIYSTWGSEDPGSYTRISRFANAGGRVIFAGWNAASVGVVAPALGTAIGGSHTAVRPIHRGTRDDAGVFNGVPSPLNTADGNAVDGFALTCSGRVLYRYDSETSASPAACLSPNGRAIHHGQVLESHSDVTDSDADGLVDLRELLQNELRLILPPQVLTFSDSGGSSSQKRGARAILAAGAVPLLVGVGDEGAFQTAFDAGNFGVILYGREGNNVPAGHETRLTQWMDRGGRLIFYHWDTDGQPTLAAALRVTVSSSHDVYRPVIRPTSPAVDVFTGLPQLSPLPGQDRGGSDNGDAYTVTAPNLIVGRFDDAATGDGAIALTRGRRVFVNGFTPFDLDSHAERLLQNELEYLLTRPQRVLYYSDNAQNLTNISNAITDAGLVGVQVASTDAVGTTLQTDSDFAVVIIDEDNFGWPGGATETSLTTWLNDGGRLIFYHWFLQNIPSMQTTLGVTAENQFTVPRTLQRTTTAPFDLLTRTGTPVTSSTDSIGFDGYDVIPADGTVVARFTSAGTPGAAALTRNGTTIVLGFSGADYPTTDTDGDTIAEYREMLRHSLSYLTQR